MTFSSFLVKQNAILNTKQQIGPRRNEKCFICDWPHAFLLLNKHLQFLQPWHFANTRSIPPWLKLKILQTFLPGAKMSLPAFIDLHLTRLMLICRSGTRRPGCDLNYQISQIWSFLNNTKYIFKCCLLRTHCHPLIPHGRIGFL